MHRLVFALLLGPFWLQFLCAGGLFWLGYTFQTSTADRVAAAAALLQQAPPETVDIAAMTTAYDHHVATEVSVRAQIALSHNTRLIHKTNFITTGEDVLYVLVDPDASLFGTVARGAIVIDADEVDLVSDWVAENAVTFGGDGPVLDVTGLLSDSVHSGMVNDALADQGMTKGPDFFYITPHFQGRVASLTPKPYAGFLAGLPVYAVALFFLLLGSVKFVLARRLPRAAATQQQAAPSRRATVGTGLSGQQIADQLIAEDIARARMEAAMTHPLVAVGGAEPTPKPKEEMFVVPDPAYVPRDPASAIVRTPNIRDGIREMLRDLLTPQIVAYVGFAVLLGIILHIMASDQGNPFAPRPFGSETDMALTLLPWVGGLIAVLVILKGFIGIPATSKRKGIYDPYLRLAEREGLDNPDHDQR
jgi:predicted anti-sigma-YlaC factor YlaD